MTYVDTLYPNKAPIRILAALQRAYPEPVTTKDLIEELFGDRPDGGPLNASRQITQSVRRLRSLGHAITSKAHSGYRLEKIDP